ncbi:MAG: tetratricopeptide repeat protein [Gammaproteobacteria bacterium]|nr:tetratricopeptide repeat protein [Gammaproteobacteria bacterium]
MLLRDSTKHRPAVRLLLPAVLLLLGGCAAPGPQLRPAASPQSAATAVVGEQPAAVEIPPQVLTQYEQAVAIMAGGDFVDAELRFKEFLLRFPGYPGAYVNLAILHSNDGDDAAAQAAVDAALALDPEYAPALNQLGMLHRRNGKFLEAEAAYLKAVTASPEYALAHYNLGVLNELYLQRLDVALQHFEHYQALAGEDKQVEKWIADLRRRMAAHQSTANVAE